MPDQVKSAKSNNRKKKQNKPNSGVSATLPAPVESTEVNAEDQLEREVTWCLQQLTISLTDPSKKHSHKQGAAAVDAIRALSNPKASLVKKRQVMRVQFGDYRSKMAEQEKQYYNNLKAPKMEQKVAPEKSSFLKKATHPKSTVRATDEAKSTTDNAATTQTDTGFKFNFQIDTGLEKTEEDPKEGIPDKGIPKEGIPKETNNAPKPAVNYYKMEAAKKTDFKFDFGTQ